MLPTQSDRWPALPYDAWKDTYATLHMWTQLVGKVALALAPPLNHSWAIAFQVTSRGLATRRLRQAGRSLTIEFDFIDHQLVIRTSDNDGRVIKLEPKTVADFHRELVTSLHELGLNVKIWPMAVEVPAPFRLDTDTAHGAYAILYANRCWRIFAAVDDVLTRCRCGFVGKASPAQFFWGGFDLALSRFSGNLAPAREGPAFMREAYSHEVISHGFWPGSAPLLEPAFYAYAVPEPAVLKDVTIRPSAAYYHAGLGEFILPYGAVRTAASPETEIAAFVDSTYEQASTLAHWNRAALERPAIQGARP